MKKGKTDYAVEQVARTRGMCRLAKRLRISRNTIWKALRDPSAASDRTKRALRRVGLLPPAGKAVAE